MPICGSSRCMKKTKGRAVFCEDCHRKKIKPSSYPATVGMTMPKWVKDFLERPLK